MVSIRAPSGEDATSPSSSPSHCGRFQSARPRVRTRRHGPHLRPYLGVSIRAPSGEDATCDPKTRNSRFVVSIRAPSGEDATTQTEGYPLTADVSIRAPSGEDATWFDCPALAQEYVSIRAPSGEDATYDCSSWPHQTKFQSARPRVRTRPPGRFLPLPTRAFQSARPRVRTRPLSLSDGRTFSVSIRAPSGEDATRGKLALGTTREFQSARPRVRTRRVSRSARLNFEVFQSARPRVRTRLHGDVPKFAVSSFNPRALG